MEVRVQFFSVSKDITGISESALVLEEGATVEQAITELIRQYPTLRAICDASMFAVGLDYASRTRLLQNGDKLSVIPPVQGG